MLNITTLTVLLVIIGTYYTHALSLGTVSERNVIKRETGDFYPDWVPFKNKKGGELGEFVQVKKKKPAKRLAPPVNFVLRAVAEPQADDYYEKGQGESEDYYEKKDWSDTFRSAKQPAPVKAADNTTEISDIEGIVNIITDNRPTTEIEKKPPKTVLDTSMTSAEEIKPRHEVTEDIPTYNTKEEVKPDSNESEIKDKEEVQETNSESEIGLMLPNEDPQKKETTVEDTTVAPKSKEYNDYDEEAAEKGKPEPTEEEKQEAETKKQRILGLVDDLKRRHEKEQREISERVKEDEFIKEERERELIRGRNIIQSSEADDGYDKYNNKNYNKDRTKPYYDEYDDATSSLNDKYKIHPPTKRPPPVTTTSTPVTTTSLSSVNRDFITKRKKTKATPNKHEESGKLSVFKNPKLYMMYDDDIPGETSTAVSLTKTTKKSSKRINKTDSTSRSTTRYTTPATLTSNESHESVRISLVPEDNETKNGEPTLFFPQKRKNKRKRKNRTRSSTPEPDSYVAETVNGIAKDTVTTTDITEAGLSVPESTVETNAVLSESGETNWAVPTATGLSQIIDTMAKGDSSAAAAAPLPVADAITSATGHKEPKHENFQHEKGAEREHYAEHESVHGEKGKKAYEDIELRLMKARQDELDKDGKPKPWYYSHMDGVHEDSKTQKGHHDKENHHGSYDDHGGYDKEHHALSDHYGAHHHEEHGKKHAKYEESGKHSKGHSTKGSHDIHKKEEYEKKVEFFEEEGDSGEEEKHGGHTHERSHSSGGHFKNGKSHAGHHDHAKGDSGNFEKGGHLSMHKGHRAAAGHDGHGKHGGGHFHKGGHDSGKKWIYHHGAPAKTANLVVIDRRADQYYHGPQYFG